MEVEVGDILICTVDKISGTTVFVDVAGANVPGTIIMSEVAAGRIRNLRDYVVPKKTIVCKVLRVATDHLDLSLRRVSQKEKKEALEGEKAEKSYEGVLKSVVGGEFQVEVEKIKKDFSLSDFFENAKEDSSKLVALLGKEKAERILEILKKQKEKSFFLKKEIKLSSSGSDGLKKIKAILNLENVIVNYVAAGRYSLTLESKNPKKGEQEMNEILDKIGKKSKEDGVDFLTL